MLSLETRCSNRDWDTSDMPGPSGTDWWESVGSDNDNNILTSAMTTTTTPEDKLCYFSYDFHIVFF